MDETKKKVRLLTKQVLMRRVIIAIIPCVLASIYFFGWRSLVMVVVSCVTAFLVEFIFTRVRKPQEPVSEAVFVSGIIYALIMPPTVPWHVLVIGISFAILFGKMVFGGFGRNIFNPAMAGRAFVYICFPVALTSQWARPAAFPWGALKMWSTSSLPDAITAATPLALVKAGAAPPPPLLDLLFGNIAGTMGVTSVIAILAGGLYLFISGTANRWLTLATIAAYAGFDFLFVLLGVKTAMPVLPALLGGGFLFGAFFMVTDPVSAPQTTQAKIIYAAIVGTAASVIGTLSVFNGGFMFALLLGNMLGPIIDYVFKERAKRKKERQKSEAKPAEQPAGGPS
ncbi:RnfABCDGE type electron transport complex subunit D [bacterium]|nr:RnfABCDGE type electron transport complex subunit D [bacterium]